MKPTSALVALLALLALFASAAPARAFDILPPGNRAVEHTLEIEAAPAFDEFDLYAWPMAGFSGHERVTPGARFTFSSKYGTRIYALPKGTSFPAQKESPPVARERIASAARAVGEIPVRELHSVSLASPIERAHTRLRIAGIDGGVLRLEVVEHHESWSTLHGTLLATAAAAGAIGLAAMVHARRRRAVAARTADRDAAPANGHAS